MISDHVRKISKTAINAVLCIVVAAIVVENVSLISENRSLHKGLDRITAPIQAGQELGDYLEATGAEGQLTSIPLPASAGDHLLIITFSPGCPACQANQDGWTKLAQLLKQRGWRVVWISRDRMKDSIEYSSKHNIPLSDSFGDPPYRTYLRLGLSRVPNTLVVAPGGNIQKVWPGQLEAAKWAEILRYFNLEQESSSSATATR